MVGKKGIAILALDQAANFLERLLGNARRIRPHVSDQAYGALAADLDALVKPLRQDHGLLHRKVQLARRILLQLARDEGGNRIALLFATMDSGNDEGLLPKSLYDGIDGLLIGHIPFFSVERAG